MEVKQLILGASLLLLMACGGKQTKTNDASLSGNVKIDGSSTVYPITEAIAEEYRTVAPNVRITVGISGTGGGFKKFSRGETDINDASRPIKDSEIEACKSNNIEYISLMIAYDGLVVVVNPENTWVDNFTVEELKKIWEPSAEEKIIYWSDIRSEWPHERINLYGPDAASGTYDYFTEAIVGQSGQSRGDYTNSSDDNVLVQGIAKDKYSLGFFGMAYYEENMSKLKVIGVNNGNDVVVPSYESVSNNSYKPLSRPVFLYVSKEAIKREEVADFVIFYLDNVSSISKDVGYVSLPANIYNEQKEKFLSFTKNQ